jgi:hypothetical protein
MEEAKRFELIKGSSDYPNDGNSCWWWDRSRPLKGAQLFMAVETSCGKDPNNFIRIEGLEILFTDQAEYYFVCPNCYDLFCSMQWSGSTQMPSWRERSKKDLKAHQILKGWCEFCDPIFGNGGWIR